MNIKKIGIIGPSKSACKDEIYDFGIKLGEQICSPDRFIICGGLDGFMEAVCRGVKQSDKTFCGQTIGILPEDNTENANQYIDVAIPTGIGFARNIIIINSSDIIIAAGGGAGTLSELAFAWQKKKTVLCVTQFGGWSNELSNKNIDNRSNGLFVPVKNIDEIINFLEKNRLKSS